MFDCPPPIATSAPEIKLLEPLLPENYPRDISHQV